MGELAWSEVIPASPQMASQKIGTDGYDLSIYTDSGPGHAHLRNSQPPLETVKKAQASGHFPTLPPGGQVARHGVPAPASHSPLSPS